MAEPFFKKPVLNRDTIYLLFALSGLSFLFFAAFPFANHNESYLWIVLLDKISFMDALTTRLEPVQSFRPLGTATAWLTYRLSGAIYLQQLFNWVFACLSFAVLFRYAKNKVVFSLAAFLATAGFFSGYIYLFHLHGVFYGPLQLYIAVLVCTAYQLRKLTSKTLAWLSLLTIAAALYHTFALLVFAGYLAGCMLEVPKAAWRQQLPKLFGLCISALLLIYFIINQHPGKPDGDVVSGTLASFTTTEINLPLRLLACLFTLFTVFTTPIPGKLKQAFLLSLLVALLLFIYFQLPILLLWIFACVVKLALSKNWAMAALVVSTAVFPIATHTGTPTYIVFVIMACVFVTALNNPLFLQPKRFFKTGIAVVPLFFLALLLLLKTGFAIPGLTNALRPLLAEQEKTQQLEQILAWKKKTTAYTQTKLRFFDESSKPSASKNAVNRTHRPPTQQGYLNRYCLATNLASADTADTQPLIITFGAKPLHDRQKLFEVQGRWNGAAYVYQ